MTISQIPGAVRLRRHQYGIQTVLNTKVAATRRVPWAGPIAVNQNWTNPSGDFGSLDPIPPPFPGALDVSSNPTGELYYNDLPLRLLAGLLGGVTPTGGGTAKTWDFQLASLTSDVFDVFTDEYGDDTEATDGHIGIGGVADSLEETMGQDLGPWTISDNWIYSTGQVGQDLTDGLTPDADGILVMGDETLFTMDTVPGSIGISPVDTGVHDAVIRVQNNLDRKRLAQGSNLSNQLSGYGRGERVIELVLTVPKTAGWITEANTILTRPKPARYFQVSTASPTEAQTGVPYSYRRRLAARLFERAEAEVGGNAAIQLTYRAFYDDTLQYAAHFRVVNTQATAVAA